MHEIINNATVLASTECQNFLLAWFSSSFVDAEWNQAQAQPAALVPALSLVWWHCGGIVVALWDSSCLTLVIPARKSTGYFGAWATTICLVNEPPKLSGIYQKCSCQTRTVNDTWTQPSICFVHGDTGTCKVWNTARRKRPPRKENPQPKLKIFWNYYPNPVCLGTWLGKITYF